MITAIVLITADVDHIPEVSQEIADLEGVSEVYSVAGTPTSSPCAGPPPRGPRRRHRRPAEQGDRGDRHQHPLAFRTYSSHDLEAAFSLGLEG